MKKLLFVACLLLSVTACDPVYAQGATGVGGSNVPEGTSFPSSKKKGDLFYIKDDSVKGACDSAAGSAKSLCRWSGSAWEPAGDGQAEGGTVTTTDIDTLGELNAIITGEDVAGLAAVQTFATGTKTVTSKFDFGSGKLEVPNSTSLPGTCVVGEIYMDTNATSGQRLYACESTDTWALQGDGGSGGGLAATDIDTLAELNAIVAGADIITTAGNAATATALASDPSDCSSNQFANAIAASGNLTCAAIADADVPNNITITLAATATALAADPADCSANTYATTIAASGALTCASVTDASIASTITRDTEWDTEAEVQTAWGSVNIILATEIDSLSELNAIITGEDVAGLAAVQTFATGTKTVTAKFDFGGGTLEVPNSTSLPGSCVVGEIYMDTNATTGQRLYACESTDTWALQGDGGGGGSGDVVGPASASDGNVACFDGTDGKLLQDCGTFAEAGTLTDGRLCTYDSAGGEIDCDTTNVPTATALAANPADCSANTYATTIAASGALTCAAITEPSVASTVTRDTEWDTAAEINAATTDDDFLTLTGSQTATNKTFTAPVFGGSITGTYTISGTPTFPASVTLDSEWDTAAEINAATSDADFATLTGAETFATGTKTVTAKFDFGGGTLEVPNSTSLPGTCVVGEAYMDTDASSGQRFYLCESSNTWTVQGGGGGGGGGYATIQEETSGLTQRATVNFVGSSFTAADDAGNTRTNITADADLNAYASNSSDGFWAHTGSGTGAARTLTEGLAVDISNAAGIAGDPTIAFDPTELTGSRTWSDGSTNTNVWTINRQSGTDPTITFGDGSVEFQALTVGSVAVPTISSTSTFTGKTHTAPNITVQALSCNTASPTWTVSSGNVATCTLNSTNITPAVTTTGLTGGSVSIKIIQSATARTITWPNGNGTSTLKVKWPSGTAPTLSTASAAEDTVTCNVFSEFIWHCVWAGSFQ